MSLPPGVREVPHPSGLSRLVVERDACTAEMFLHGATLTSWIPRGHREVLFTSSASHYRPDKPIRGGVPLCWPWFGPRAGFAQHGFARTAPWTHVATELDHDAVLITLALTGDGRDPAFPHRYALRYQVTLGTTLECALEVTNTDDAPWGYEDALHAYFAVEDARALRIRGLENSDYLDRSGGGAGTPRTSEPTAFSLTAETDRLYRGTTAPIEIVDGGRTITLAKDGSNTTVVWNPWADKARAMADLGDDEWTRMVCVEPANAQDGHIALAPGATHVTRMRVAVNRL